MGKSRPFDLGVCDAIESRRLLEFDYEGRHRVVEPYCHGHTHRGQEALRAVQVAGESRSGGLGFGKLWIIAKITNLRVSDRSFVPNDPQYNPADSAMAEIHCRVER